MTSAWVRIAPDADAGGVGGARVLADGAEIEAPGGAIEEVGGRRHGEERDVGERRLVEEHRAEERDVGEDRDRRPAAKATMLGGTAGWPKTRR